MLARAVANEAGVAVPPRVGLRVRGEVRRGRRAARPRPVRPGPQARPGVIFVDEFDALAKQRGGPNGHEEREQTLNQLLVELDGFATNDDVVVIAATNRLDVLDTGRAAARDASIARSTSACPTSAAAARSSPSTPAASRSRPAVELDGLARKTYGFSGAQLADLLNEAAILAARRGGDDIDGPRPPRGLAQGRGRHRPPAVDGRARAGDHRRPRGRARDLRPGPRRQAAASRRSACSPTARRSASR